MAEQVEITNVGNNGVASEVTLKLLLDAIEKMAKNAGLDPKTVKEKTKQLQEETKGIKNIIFSLDDNSEALEDNTEAIKDSTGYMTKFKSMLANSVLISLGAVTGSLTGLTKEVFGSQTSLAAFSQHLPFVGTHLAVMANYLDETVNSFRTLSNVGASFNNSLVDLRRSAAESHMALSEYTDLIRRNSERLASFGGTVTNGTQQTKRLFSALGPDLQQQLMTMGLTVTDINEGLIFFQHITRSGARTQQRDTQAQAIAAAEYIKQLNTLSKLTGQDAASMREKLAAQQSDIAFQMRLAKMSVEERELVQAGLAEAFALQGETGAQYFKQQLLGMPPLTEATRMLVATMPNAAAQLANLARITTGTNMSMSQFNAGSVDRMGDFIEGAARDAQSLESVLAAASAGLDGQGKVMLDIFREQNIDMAKYFDQNGKLNRQMLDQDLKEAAAEADRSDRINRSIQSFQNNISTLRSKIMNALVDSGIFDAAANAIEGFTALFDNKEIYQNILVPLTNFANDIKNIAESFMKDFNAEGFWAAIGKMIGNVVTSDTVSNLFSGIIDGIGTAIGSAVSAAWDNSPIITAIVLGFGAVFAAAKIKNALVGLLSAGGGGGGGGGGLSGLGAGLRSLGRGTGLGIASVGRGLGVGLNASLRGLATGLAAFANPATLIGLGAITLAVNGFALALRLAGPSLEQFGNMIKSVFEGAKPLLEGFAEVLRGLGDGVGSILEGISTAFIGLGTGIKTVLEGISTSFVGLGTGIKTVLDGVSNVVTSIGNGITSVITSIANGIGNVIGKITEYKAAGIEATTAQIERLSAIPGTNLEAAARGIEQMKLALEGFQPGFFESLGSFLTNSPEQMTTTTTNIQTLSAAFATMNPEQISAASNAVKLMGESLVAFAKGLAANTGSSFLESIASWFGSGEEESIVDKVVNMSAAFAALNGEAVIAGSKGVNSIAKSLQNLAASKIKDFEFNGNLIRQIERISKNASGITTAAASLQTISQIRGLDTNISSFNSSLDFSVIDNYADSIENLKEALEELNKVLAKSNDTLLTERLSAGELLQDVGVTNRLTSDRIETLNTTLVDILNILTENRDIDTRIERNTRTFGSDISRGTISTIR